ncbi:MAG: LA2681 family HEPN domain-containing protein [Mariprofundaceae bacterium]|nr:LA2681 family HEPN domain-containing protein [Mariprofundaceae bacterium]
MSVDQELIKERRTVEEELGKLLHVDRLDGLANHDALNLLGMLVNEADDTRCVEKVARALNWCDQLNSREWSGSEAVRFHYNWANAWAARRHILMNDASSSSWEWNHPELGQELFHLRMAIKEPEFDSSENYQKCQIYVNTANALNTLGRPVQALEYWNRALQIIPNYGMALGNHGLGLMSYARQLYDGGHAMVLMKFAYEDFKSAISAGAYYEDNGYETVKTGMETEANNIETHIDLAVVNSTLDLHHHSLGESKEEQEYRRWCLTQRLFLNPINDLGTYPIAARDIFGLPSITVSIKEPPVLYGFFNQLKQEYVSARYMYYEGICSDGVHFSDRDVALVNTLDYPAYSIAVEREKVAFRLLYSIFDKLAYFINSYWRLGMPEKQVSFRSVWVQKGKTGKVSSLRDQFDGYENLPMRGLYWLSKDILENDAMLEFRGHNT